MYKLWHSEVKKPLLLTYNQVRVYVALMRAMNQGTPRWCRYVEGNDELYDDPEWCIQNHIIIFTSFMVDWGSFSSVSVP